MDEEELELDRRLDAAIASGDKAAQDRLVKEIAQKRMVRDTALQMEKGLGFERRVTGAADIMTKRLERERAQDLGPLQNFLEGRKPLPKAVQESSRIAEMQRAPGPAQQIRAEGGNVQAPMGTDLEGALKVPGAREIILGGRRAVRNDEGLLAIRNEEPSLGDSIREKLTKGGEMGWLPLAGNLFDIGTRPLATAAAHAIAHWTDDDERLARSPGFLSDLKQAALNEKGNTLTEGGLVATRESGWGDTIRYMVKKALKARPNAILADLLPQFEKDGKVLDASGNWVEREDLVGSFWGKPLNDVVDADYELLGMLASIPLDPLNVLPIGKGIDAVSGLAKKTKVGGRLAEFGEDAALLRLAPDASPLKGGERAAAEAYNWSYYFPDMVGKVAGEYFSGMSPKRLSKVLQQAGESKATGDYVGKQLSHDWQGSLGEQGLLAEDAIRVMDERVVGRIYRDEVDALNYAAESIVKTNDLGDVVDAFRQVPDSALWHLPPRMRSDVVAFKELTPFEVDVVKIGRGDADLVGEYEKVVAKLPVLRQYELAEALGRAGVPVNIQTSIDDIARQLLEGGKVSGRKGLLRKGATAEERALEVAAAARDYAAIYQRGGARAKEFGKLSLKKTSDGYIPHIAKGMGEFNPLAKRSMIEGENLVRARDKAYAFLREVGEDVMDPAKAKKLNAWLDLDDVEQFRKLRTINRQLDGFFDDILPKARTKIPEDALFQARQLAGELIEGIEVKGLTAGDTETLVDWMKLSVDDQAKQLDDIWEIVEDYAVGQERLVDELADANRLLRERTYGRAEMETDPRKMTGKWLGAMGAKTSLADAGARFANIKHGDFQLATDLGDFVHKTFPKEQSALYTKVTPSGKRVLTKMAKGDDGFIRTDITRALNLKGYRVVDADVAQAMPKLRGKVVLDVVHTEIKRLIGSQDPSKMDAAFKAIGALNKFWVPLLLSTPGFHVRNWMYGQAQLYMAMGKKAFDPALARDARHAATLAEFGRMSDISGVVAKDDLVKYADEMRRHGITETGKVADLERHMRSGASFKGFGPRELASKAFNRMTPWSRKGPAEWAIKRAANRWVAGGVSAPGDVMALANKGKVGAYGASIENMQRAQLYIWNRRRGMSETEAAEEVVKFLFDYTGARLGKFEKGLRQVFPFYQWMKFSNIQIVDQMLRSQRYRNMQKAFDLLDAEHISGVSQASDPRARPEQAIKRGAFRMPKVFEDSYEDTLVALKIFNEKEVRDADRYWAFERPGPNLIDPTNIMETMIAQMGLVPKLLYEGTTGRYTFGGSEISPGFNSESQVRALGAAQAFFESLAGMPADEVLPYLVPMVGGPNANLLMRFFGENKNPRFTDTQQAEAFASTLLSMMTGQKIIPANAVKVYERRIGEAKQMQKDYDTRAAREAKKAVRGPSVYQQLRAAWFEEKDK